MTSAGGRIIYIKCIRGKKISGEQGSGRRETEEKEEKMSCWPIYYLITKEVSRMYKLIVKKG